VSDLTGELIDGRYQLQKLIAAGGMASIYAAMDLRLDRLVAVKIMHPHLANDEDFVNRFIKEAKATAALNHPNVVSIQDQGWNEGGSPAVFIVMEYIDGNTLRDYLFERGSLPVGEVLRFLIPVVSALAEAHSLGIIHRDIKPENILISKDGRIKIADFGLARGDQLGSTQTAESSVVLGSVSYLSPEQVQRGISDARSDVYSLGIVLFELLIGRKPFDGDTPIQIAYKHVNDRVPSVRAIKSEIPENFDQLVTQATSPNPDHRFKDARELLNALRNVQESIDPQKRQLSLELDLPIPPARPVKRTKTGKTGKTGIGDIRIGGQVIDRVKSFTQPIRPSEATPTSEIRRRASKRVKRNRVIAIALVLTLSAAGWYQFIGPGSQIAIPSVVGLSVGDAKKQISQLGLVADISSQDFSEDVERGLVLTSIPGGGGHLPKGETVHLILSKGKERISIPSLAGLTQDAATAALINAGLKVGNVTQVFDMKIASTLVVDGNPATSTEVRRNSIVDLIISKGIEQLTLNSYIGKSSDQATNELTDAGFIVKSAFSYSEVVPAGAVISQTPSEASGVTSAPKGSTITLVISRGTQSVFIPNLFSLSEKQARTSLESLQLKVSVKKIGSKKIKKVTGISPKVGTQVKRGAVVVITLS
jgi:eukaryotic-like serine/threonine-protein kinase